MHEYDLTYTYIDNGINKSKSWLLNNNKLHILHLLN